MTRTGQNHNKNIVQTSHHESSRSSEKTTAASLPPRFVSLTVEQFLALMQEARRGDREEKGIQSTCRKSRAKGMKDARVQTLPARRTKTGTMQASSSRAVPDMEKKGTRDKEIQSTCRKRTARGMEDARVQTSPARRTKTGIRQASSSRAVLDMEKKGTRDKEIQSTCRKSRARGIKDARVQTSPARRTKTGTRQAGSSRAVPDVEKKGTRDKESPFSKDIMTQFVKAGFRLPSLPKFEGKGDAYEHVLSVESIMTLYNMSDGLNCKVFITTLTGRAVAWFGQLEKESICSYQQLIDKFLAHFGWSHGWSRRGARNSIMFGCNIK